MRGLRGTLFRDKWSENIRFIFRKVQFRLKKRTQLFCGTQGSGTGAVPVRLPEGEGKRLDTGVEELDLKEVGFR